MEDYELAIAENPLQSAQYMYAPDSQVKAQTDLDLLKSEYRTKVITCAEADFDATYDAWLKAAENAGIKDILADRQEIYNNVKGSN